MVAGYWKLYMKGLQKALCAVGLSGNSAFV